MVDGVDPRSSTLSRSLVARKKDTPQRGGRIGTDVIGSGYELLKETPWIPFGGGRSKNGGVWNDVGCSIYMLLGGVVQGSAPTTTKRSYFSPYIYIYI